MEKIKINDMQTKGVVFIVKYQNQDQDQIKEATLNINFNKQEIWYLENEVGIGGTVDVEIIIKEKVKGNPSAGFYVNITKVNMTSAVKGGVKGVYTKDDALKDGINALQTMYSDKDRSIIAQCLTKVFCKNQAITADAEGTRFVLESYNYFLKEL